MKKAEHIGKYGQAAYEKRRQQTQQWRKVNSEHIKTHDREWRENNPNYVQAKNRETHRKGGKYYDASQERRRHGIAHEKFLIRTKHAKHYRPYKQIIAAESQIHHEWIPGTADYTGVALVEADQHMHGFVDVIQILEGEITLFTEAEIRGGLA